MISKFIVWVLCVFFSGCDKNYENTSPEFVNVSVRSFNDYATLWNGYFIVSLSDEQKQFIELRKAASLIGDHMKKLCFKETNVCSQADFIVFFKAGIQKDEQSELKSYSDTRFGEYHSTTRDYAVFQNTRFAFVELRILNAKTNINIFESRAITYNTHHNILSYMIMAIFENFMQHNDGEIVNIPLFI